MRRFFSRFLIVCGLFLMLGAGGLTGYNLYDSYRAQRESDEILNALGLAGVDASDGADSALAEEGPGEGGEADPAEDLTNRPLYELYPEMAMPAKVINGYRYVAVVEIPSIGITLPVMEEWDYPRLKIAPCRYSGSAYTHDLVIAGHNYRSHFSKIKWMNVGEVVTLTDMAGNVFHYRVVSTEVLSPRDVFGMTGVLPVGETEPEPKDDGKTSADGSESAGEETPEEKWDMTLFTCTTGGGSRFALRCALTEEEG